MKSFIPTLLSTPKKVYITSNLFLCPSEIQAAAGNLDAHVQSFNLQHQNHTAEFGALHEEENSVMNDCEDSLDEAGNMAGPQGISYGIFLCFFQSFPRL